MQSFVITLIQSLGYHRRSQRENIVKRKNIYYARKNICSNWVINHDWPLLFWDSVFCELCLNLQSVNSLAAVAKPKYRRENNASDEWGRVCTGRMHTLSGYEYKFLCKLVFGTRVFFCPKLWPNSSVPHTHPLIFTAFLCRTVVVHLLWSSSL